ncbi:hypothetical protein Clacol_006217 [Clathrus columnatus]|uniref:Uncharacterized protein n=1 Tax=Clathrus columnatus TaxID=1419009 RepID=A0AAV5AH25_9AGAM|nr:hypothetical protein Clacol_006217 [Clathrus columnatus]
MSQAATFFTQPPRASPRHYRIGGFVIGNDDAAKWASQLIGKELDPVMNSSSIRIAVLKKTYPFDVNFRLAGEVAHVYWMLITQSARFNGNTNMDPAEIPQFEPGERDVHAERLLKEAGFRAHQGQLQVLYKDSSNALGIKEYKFATFLD